MGPDLGVAALALAAKGLRVFPLTPGGKTPLGRLVAHGVKDATTDHETIAAWWRDEPEANIGIATGDGHAVLDLDVDAEKGLDGPARVAELGIKLPATTRALTPRGGSHVYLRLPAGADVANSAGAIAPGVDVRGRGGYVVAPPSRRADGKGWTWAPGSNGLAFAPDELLALMTKKRPEKAPRPRQAPRDVDAAPWAKAALESELARVRGAAEGQRNQELNRAAYNLGQIVAGGSLSETDVADALTAAALDAGLGETETRKTIASGLAAGARDPRWPPEREPGRGDAWEPPPPPTDEDGPPDSGDIGDIGNREGAWEPPPPPTDEDGPPDSGDIGDIGNREGAWEPPVPLGRAETPPAFPVAALPTWLRRQVEAVADFSQTPPDMAATMALTVLSACARGRYEVEVPFGHVEPLILYSAVVLASGERKTAVVDAMAGPIVSWERDLAEREQPIVEETKSARKILAKRIDSLTTKAAGAKDAKERAKLTKEIGEAHRELLATPELVPPRLLVDNATTEAMVSILAEQGGRIALFSAEGGIFDLIAGLYSEGRSNLDLWLKAYDAEAVRIDRKGRPPEYVRRACITIGLAVQPGVITAAASDRRFRDRGLLARFLFSLPPSRVGHRDVDVLPTSRSTAVEYERRVRQLLDDVPGEVATIRCSGEAMDVWRDFAREIEPRLDPAVGDLAHVADWAGKLPGRVGRFAGLLHLAEHAAHEGIDVSTMKAAVLVGRWALSHALVAFDLMGADQGCDDARRVLAWIERGRVKELSARDAWQALRGSLHSMDNIRAALSRLEQHGYVRRLPKKNGPGRPSERFEVNPRLWDSPRSQYTQNPQNPRGGEGGGP